MIGTAKACLIVFIQSVKAR